MTNPREWGPALWTSLLHIVLEYPDQPTETDRADYQQFFTSLGKVLPCLDCRQNYCQHMDTLPITGYLDSRQHLLDWLWQVHNQVNDACQRTRRSKDEFLERYLPPESTTGASGSMSFLTRSSWGPIIILTIFTVLLVWYFSRNGNRPIVRARK
jgi:hypothetical protein